MSKVNISIADLKLWYHSEIGAQVSPASSPERYILVWEQEISPGSSPVITDSSAFQVYMTTCSKFDTGNIAGHRVLVYLLVVSFFVAEWNQNSCGGMQKEK